MNIMDAVKNIIIMSFITRSIETFFRSLARAKNVYFSKFDVV